MATKETSPFEEYETETRVRPPLTWAQAQEAIADFRATGMDGEYAYDLVASSYRFLSDEEFVEAHTDARDLVKRLAEEGSFEDTTAAAEFIAQEMIEASSRARQAVEENK